MPNQRASNKEYLGGFVDKRFYAEIARAARQAGMEDNRFGFVNQLIQEALELRRRKRSRHGSPSRR